MFPTLPKPSRLSNLIMGAVLALLLLPAQAQTLADARALMKEGKMTQALERIDRYIAARPGDAQGPFTKGLILSEMGRSQEAIQVFARLTENFPELPEPYNNLAVLYAREKQYDKAQTALETAIRTHPSYAVAHENLGGIYAKLASQAYDKALQLDSSNRATQTRLSMIQELNAVQARPGVQIAAAPEKTGEPAKTAAVETPPAPMPAVKPTAPQTAGKAPEKTGEGGKTDAGAGGKAESEVIQTIRDWAGAWSRKDVKAYLAFYAGNFQTPKGMTLRNWQTERRQRIDKPGRLQVAVTDIKIAVSGDKATARFRQQYVSATFKSMANKTLVFVKTGDRWLILQERVN
jgi:tetratricopeptide (TPR) repeat protein